MKQFLTNLYNILFNSKGTAIICLIVLSGLAVYGGFALVGNNQVATAVVVAMIILLVDKILNKVIK